MKLAINGSWATSLAIASAMILNLSGVAGASDGVIEINQACAENTGCSSGDGAGFPVDLGGFGTARSYILTSDLTPTNSGSTMFINGDGVTLNMNGFSILCSPSSTYGIRYASPAKNLHVSNGTIRGCQSGGIGGGGSALNGGAGARIEGLTVDACAAGGIDVGANSSVVNTTVTGSGTTQVGSSPTLTGIRLGENCIARNNVVSGATVGIQSVFTGCLYSGNTVRDNISSGLVGVAATFLNNISTGNGGNGIVANDGSNVIGNTLRNNTRGFTLTSDTSYRGNSIIESTVESIAGGVGINQGNNICAGPLSSSACP